MRERASKVGLVCFALLVMLALPGEALAQTPQMCSQPTATVSPEPAVVNEIQQIFEAASQSCNTARCRTNADCAAICPDVAKCCADAACEFGTGGGWGYCILM